MKKSTKIWLVIATCLLLAVGIIFGGVMTMLKWDFSKLSTVKYETNNYELNTEFENISIITNTSDIIFLPSENDKTEIICFERQKSKHSVTSKDKTLLIEVVDERKWYDYIGIDFHSPKITISIPQGMYTTLKIKSDTGNVNIPDKFDFGNIEISLNTGNVTSLASATENIRIKTSTGNILTRSLSASSLKLSTSTGEITASDIKCDNDFEINVSTGNATVTDVNCGSFTSEGSTGNILLKNVKVSGLVDIERSTGDVKFDACDASEINVETDTGNISGSLLSDKIFFAETKTGRIDVPQSTQGGKCKIETDTGDISFTIINMSQWREIQYA